ncbi:TRAP transporter small permease subunit [Rhodoferax aquaticus]|uniref:TRAP transporter small permease protein n=1 Tax=Rhodoferax aquaticus TaxID=2527691 RepID=A0A515EMN5_9BURK|nr:TRAP transporter small permease subunit [Rhodoferax aquaticus]QDL53927.1 TRAP transporter small permease subunit [Rhodoferax aquaticus]
MKNSSLQRWTNHLMAACLAVMAIAVFTNVVLRYGFGSGVAASEELSRLLFVWMVFIGATGAYPMGEHMAFTSLLQPLLKPGREVALKGATRLIHALVVLSCALVGWGAWQQVVVGLDSVSVVLGYPQALLPLPALLSSAAIGAMALVQFIQGKAIDFGHGAEVE